MRTFLGRPESPVSDKTCGTRSTEVMYASREVSNTERAVLRARAWEKAYRAPKVESGRGEGGGVGRTDGSESEGVLPRMIKSPWSRVVLIRSFVRPSVS